MSARSPVRSSTSPKKSPGSTKRKSTTQVDQTENPKLQEYLKIEISKLRQMKQQAIKKLDFVESGLIEEAIKKLSTTDNTDIISKVKEEANTMVNNHFAACDEQVLAAKNQRKEKEMNLRKQINNSFNSVKEQYKEKIKSLEVDRQVKIAIDEKRPINAAYLLEQKAQTLAAMDDTERAIETLAQADAIRKEAHEKMAATINNKYDNLIQQALDQAKVEIDNLQTKLARKLELYQAQCDKQIGEIYKKTAVLVNGSTLKAIAKIRKDIRDSNRLEQSKAQKQLSDAAVQVAAFVEKKIQDEEREYIFINTEE